ncbi:MAG: sugar transferase [Intestinibaculum porci]|uniref:sugar transferase n=1 Tax=Intestinibaculum porci TaxID=2487118 RepID=UPI003F0817E2
MEKNCPQYSVLMCVYAREHAAHFREALMSIANQTLPTDDLVLLCDGPLTKELDQVIDEMQDYIGKSLHVYRESVNRGAGIAHRLAFEKCQHEFIAVADSDDISKPDRCAKELAVFKAHPELSMVGCFVEEFDEDPSQINAVRKVPETTEEIIQFSHRRNPINHPTVMFKKSDVKAAGGYQDFYLLEDYFLWVRMLQMGMKAYNIQEALVYMRAGSGMYKRRGGSKYAQSQRKLFKYMYDTHYISFQDYIYSCVVRTLSGFIPDSMRRGLFMRFNRSDVAIKQVRHRLRDQVEDFILDALNVIIMTLSFAIFWLKYYSHNVARSYAGLWDLSIIIFFMIVYAFCYRLYKSVQVSEHLIRESLFNGLLSNILAIFGAIIVMFVWRAHMFSLVPLLLLLINDTVLCFVFAVIENNTFIRLHRPRKATVILNQNEFNMQLLSTKLKAIYAKVDIIHVDDCLSNIREVLADSDDLYLSDLPEEKRTIIVNYALSQDLDTFVLPQVGDAIMSASHPSHIFHLPIFKIERFNPSIFYLFFKRFFDIVLSLMALIILSPIMIIIAIAIKAEDHGDVFFKQTRLTKNGQEFMILKFRSMTMQAESDGVARLSTGKNDQRVTKVGKIIRPLRLDELPQLINIFKGDMSIVGPRPERPEIANAYVAKVPEFDLRLQAKAGLTGYAQVYGQYNTCPHDKLLMDLSYIATPNLLEDFRLCLATIKVIFVPESTDGIEEGQVNALQEGEIHENTSRSA